MLVFSLVLLFFAKDILIIDYHITFGIFLEYALIEKVRLAKPINPITPRAPVTGGVNINT
jgi:hypothetical protein